MTLALWRAGQHETERLKEFPMLVENPAPAPAGSPNGFVRRHNRALFTVPIALRHLVTGGVRTSRGVSLDLSESGMGALVQDGLNIGDTVEIDFRLPQRPLSLIGIIRHTTSVRSGLEFVGLNAEERVEIAGIIGHG